MIKDINLVKTFLVNCLNVLSVSYTDVWVSHFCDIQSVLAEFNITHTCFFSPWKLCCLWAIMEEDKILCCISMAMMVMWTHHNITLYIHCLSCCYFHFWCMYNTKN